MKADRAAAGNFVGEEAEKFEYPESADAPFVPVWTGWDDAPDSPDANAEWRHDAQHLRPMAAHGENAAGAELDRRLAEEARRSFEAGRARGIEDGRKAEREARLEAVAATAQDRIRQSAELVEKFAEEREHYFKTVEPEVVRLALAVAARILRREAASDPLLLMGAVRAALGQIAGATEVRLQVPAAELDLWTEAICLLPHLADKPAVLAGEDMALGDCRIETSLGTADLGVRAQLAEMERALVGNAASRQKVEAARLTPASASTVGAV